VLDAYGGRWLRGERHRGGKQNKTDEAVSITLSNEEGAHVFTEVPAKTATTYEDLAWTLLSSVVVTIDRGTAKGGTVTLTRGTSNLIVVKDNKPPKVKVPPPPVPQGPAPSPGGGW
ncbi:MAG: hypothetical protein AAF211_30580, partial [Myxococcota bacterium]